MQLSKWPVAGYENTNGEKGNGSKTTLSKIKWSEDRVVEVREEEKRERTYVEFEEQSEIRAENCCGKFWT